MFYVYSYVENGVPYYIGKGKENRAYVKNNHPQLPDTSNIHILSYYEDNVQALIKEWELINFLGLRRNGGLLVNKVVANVPPDTTGMKFPNKKRWKLTEEQKQKLRKPKNYVRTAEHSEKIARQNRGRKQSIETRRKRAESMQGNQNASGNTSRALSYIITFPDGHEEKVYNMAEFCKVHNLTRSAMCLIAKGKAEYHKRYKCRYEGK
jgi:hypothetical protein